MIWTVKISDVVYRYYQRLDRPTRERVRKALEELAQSEEPTVHRNVAPLVGALKGFYRLRVGKYRLIFAVIRESRTIAVVNLVPRGSAYRG